MPHLFPSKFILITWSLQTGWPRMNYVTSPCFWLVDLHQLRRPSWIYRWRAVWSLEYDFKFHRSPICWLLHRPWTFQLAFLSSIIPLTHPCQPHAACQPLPGLGTFAKSTDTNILLSHKLKSLSSFQTHPANFAWHSCSSLPLTSELNTPPCVSAVIYRHLSSHTNVLACNSWYLYFPD